MLVPSLKNELEKLIARKKYIVFLILDAAGCLFFALMQMLTQLVAGSDIDMSGLFDEILISAIGPYLLFFIPLMALLAAGDLFSGEYHDLSIRAMLLRPVERWQLFCAKTIAVFLLCTVFIFAHLFFLFLVKLIFAHTAAGILYAFGAYLLDLIPTAVLVLFFVCIHQFVKSSGSAVALSVVSYLVLVCVGRYVTFAGGLVFTEYLNWHSIWLGAIPPLLVVLPKVGIVLGSAIVLYCGGYYLFERKEI